MTTSMKNRRARIGRQEWSQTPLALPLCLAVGVGTAVVLAPPLAVAMCVGLVALATAALIPSSPGVRVVTLLWAAHLGVLLVPRLAGLFVELCLVLAAVAASQHARRSKRRDPVAALGALSVGVALLWSLLMLHPNVPDLTTGLLGFRKSALVFVALALGLYAPRARAPQLLNLAYAALVALGASAVVVHLAFPGFEQGLPRAADAVTSTFEGRPRLQGLLPGPFHAAILGAFLFLAATYRYLLGVRRRAVIVGGVVGALLVVLAQVRAGYVAAILGFICILVLSARRRERFLGRWMMVSLSGLLLGAALLSGAAGSGDPALDSIRAPQTITSDQRFANRYVAWGEASGLFLASPLVGWGTGSAGDTLGDRFVGRRHVTSHNALLKYLVEGGLIGVGMVFLVVARARSLARSAQRALPLTTAAVLTAVITGLTTPVSEAVPVSTTIMLLVGLELRSSRS